MSLTTSGTRRLLGAVDAAQRHDEAVRAAAGLLLALGDVPAGERFTAARTLLDTWTAIDGDDAGECVVVGDPEDPGDRVDPDPASAPLILDAVAGEVLALPPEPAVGTTVEIVGRPQDWQGATSTRIEDDALSWFSNALGAQTWGELLEFAGPRGVRVLPAEGGQR